ncbi:MAG: ABC transporter ATP-binding protein [Lachnospiraceae bacterium]|nr:ABC transporter ATP-binding protein [Lachnospiraceae bacterium]
MSLVIQNMSKQYGNSDKATLKDIQLEIEAGEFVCIVGASGCGKSTLLNIVAGLEKPTSGHVYLDGEEIAAPGADKIVMFQEHGLFPWLNVIENVKFGMKLQGVSKEVQQDRAEHYLKMVNLYDYKDYPIHQISGGMRQRTALARALTMDSKILLMDEPFASLDKQTSNRLREELQRIWMQTGRTILFITHSVEEAIYLADRVVVLSPDISGIKDIVSVNLERPRHVYAPEFTDLRHRILEEVRGEAI